MIIRMDWEEDENIQSSDSGLEKMKLSEKKDQECYNRSHQSIPSTDLRERRKGLENGMKKEREKKERVGMKRRGREKEENIS